MALSLWFVWLAPAFAFGTGLSFYQVWTLQKRRVQQKRHIQEIEEERIDLATKQNRTVFDKVIQSMEMTTRTLMITKKRIPPWMLMRMDKAFDMHCKQAGLEGLISAEAFAVIRLRLALGCALGAFIIGAMISTQLGLLLMGVGFLMGWTLPKRSICRRIEWRKDQMESHLPEMLDVLALGMRSGLSFDASLKLYASRFNTMLASEFKLAQRKWSTGLERRDEALRKLSSSYASPLFDRLVETMIRSLRFGSSMVVGLEEDAREARSVYRSQREESIAKAPVKMMVPTGTLILPAMLILVLGPVLLELMGGAV